MHQDIGSDRFDVAIVGTGPTGLVTALALAFVARGTDAKLCLIGPAPQKDGSGADTRTAALMESSVQLLRRFGVWPQLAPYAAPLEAIRIIDAANRSFTAPDVLFKAREMGLAAFGYNIPNTTLVQVLYDALRERVAMLPNAVTTVALDERKAWLSCSDGTTVRARLVVGADGRRSICRAAAGIRCKERRYPQAAIATSFQHAKPHQNVSTELHLESGPLTTVPLPDPTMSSLVWVSERAEADALMAMDEVQFAHALEQQLYPVTGSILSVGARASFPLSGLTAKEFTGQRVALVGEAAHILPPIGAQGLNLGFRDAAWLAERLAPVFAAGGDPGESSALTAYAHSRMFDVMTRTVGVDLLNRSLLSAFLPAQIARGMLLRGLRALPPLRRLAMRMGIAPATALPALMRPVT